LGSSPCRLITIDDIRRPLDALRVRGAGALVLPSDRDVATRIARELRRLRGAPLYDQGDILNIHGDNRQIIGFSWIDPAIMSRGHSSLHSTPAVILHSLEVDVEVLLAYARRIGATYNGQDDPCFVIDVQGMEQPQGPTVYTSVELRRLLPSGVAMGQR
jgi:hypothetical protein